MQFAMEYSLRIKTGKSLSNRIVLHAFLFFLLGYIPLQGYPGHTGMDCTAVWLQDQQKAVITGKISDETGTFLPYATVFIANSTLGCISDEEGNYRLENIPFGQHQLVVSFVGYNTFEKKLGVNQERIELNIRMIPAVVELDKVEVVERKSKSTWRSNYRKFKNNFLGATPNASACDIINPEVLRFHYDKESKVLRAHANEMLVIENKALGYRIHYILKRFELKPDGSNLYLGQEKFEPLIPQNEKEQKRWKRYRREAYYGSFRHFLTSLANHTLGIDGFRVIQTDSMIPLANQKREKNQPEPELSGENELARESPSMEYERMLLFSSACLHVRYVYESDNLRGLGYQRTIDKLQPYQESWIKPLNTTIVFHEDGYLYNPESVMVYGYWAREKIAEALPLDYNPRQ